MKAETDFPGRHEDDSLHDLSFQVASLDCDFETQNVSGNQQQLLENELSHEEISQTNFTLESQKNSWSKSASVTRFGDFSEHLVTLKSSVMKDKHFDKRDLSTADPDWYDQEADLCDLTNVDTDEDFIPDCEPKSHSRNEHVARTVSHSNQNKATWTTNNMCASNNSETIQSMLDLVTVKGKSKRVKNPSRCKLCQLTFSYYSVARLVYDSLDNLDSFDIIDSFDSF